MDDIIAQQNFKHIEFVLLEIKLYQKPLKVFFLENIIPHLVFYKGSEILIIHQTKKNRFIEDLKQFAQECLQWIEYLKSWNKIFQLTNIFMTFTVGIGFINIFFKISLRYNETRLRTSLKRNV